VGGLWRASLGMMAPRATQKAIQAVAAPRRFSDRYWSSTDWRRPVVETRSSVDDDDGGRSGPGSEDDESQDRLTARVSELNCPIGTVLLGLTGQIQTATPATASGNNGCSCCGQAGQAVRNSSMTSSCTHQAMSAASSATDSAPSKLREFSPNWAPIINRSSSS
jgi:hypothetical protein